MANYCNVLNEITDFASKGGKRDYVTVYSSGAFWSRPKSKTGRSYSLQEIIKSCLGFLINNSFFRVGSKIFCQAIRIPMVSDPAPFSAILFLLIYESRWLKSIKNTNYGDARKFDNIFRFINDLLATNDGNEFENHCNEIYPLETNFKKGKHFTHRDYFS